MTAAEHLYDYVIKKNLTVMLDGTAEGSDVTSAARPLRVNADQCVKHDRMASFYTSVVTGSCDSDSGVFPRRNLHLPLNNINIKTKTKPYYY